MCTELSMPPLAHNSGPSTAHQRYAIEWRIAGGPLMARRCVLARQRFRRPAPSYLYNPLSKHEFGIF